MKGLGTFLRLLLSRAVLIGLLILAQIVLLVAGIIYLSKDFIYLYIFFIMLSVVVCVWILNNRHYTPDIKLAWIIPIAFFPVFGGLFYLIFGTFHLSASEREYLRTLNQTNRAHLPASPFLSVGAQPRAAGSADQSDALFSTAANQAGNPQTPFYAAMYKHSRYITLTSDYPSYFHTDTRYYPLGEPMWQDMLADLHKAQHFIFLEYFIIEPGAM